MKVLIACEFSGRVRDAFRRYGHTAALRRVVATHDRDMAALRRRIDEAENCIRSRTDIAVDVPVGWNSPCQIIVVGRYKGGDYIQTFTVQSGDLGQIVDLLKDMVRYGVVRHVDAAPHVRGFFPFGQQRDKGRR